MRGQSRRSRSIVPGRGWTGRGLTAGYSLDAVAYRPELPNNVDVEDISGERDRGDEPETYDEPSDQNGAVGFGGQLIRAPVNLLV